MKPVSGLHVSLRLSDIDIYNFILEKTVFFKKMGKPDVCKIKSNGKN